MNEGPINRYRRLVQEGVIFDDDAQRAAAEKLQILRCRLLMRRDASKWSRLFKRSAAESGDRGLYMYGSVGRGKSLLMDLLFDTVQIKDKRRVHFHAFMQEIHRAIREARGSAQQGHPVQIVAAQIAQETGLLCFDEFQVENIADAMILGQLFEVFFEAGMTIVATSNVPPDELYRDGLSRDLFLPFIALIRERLDLHHLAGPRDYRVGGASQDVYFSPIGPVSEGAMDDAWSELVDGRQEAATALRVLGREVVFERSCATAARVDFETLCGGPLGPADYLAMADAFETLFVDNVPRLPPSRRDAAKRFTTFIDTLYEQRRGLVMSADGAPDEIYPAGDGAGAFQRTASRLHEMRSTDYQR